MTAVGKKKFLIVCFVIAIALILGLIATVAVLALNTQDINSNINISYTVSQGVKGRVKASYIIGNTEVEMTDSSGGKTLDLEDSNLALQPNGNIELTQQNTFVVFKYVFDNTNVFEYYIQPNYIDTTNDDTNITISYSIDGTTYIEEKDNIIVEPETTQLYYIKVAIADKKQSATCTGTLNWEITNTDPLAPKSYNLRTSNQNDVAKTVEISGMLLTVSELYIPNILRINKEKYTVTKIADGNSSNSAFGKQIILQKVSIEDGVSIGNYAFNSCSNLKTVITISKNNSSQVETYIGDGAFVSCTQLTNITFSEKLTRFGGTSFMFCSKLKSVYIPKNVSVIGFAQFTGCNSLESISVDPQNSVYDSRNNCNAIIQKSNNKLIFGAINTKIPTSVKAIDAWSFNGRDITSITIPSSVTSIGNGAFGSCSKLTSIVFPSSIAEVGEMLFSSCTSLVSVEFLGAKPTFTALGLWFNGCTALEKFIVPDAHYDSYVSSFSMHIDASKIIKKSQAN